MAKILNPTHLESSQPLSASKGRSIKISLPDDDEDDLYGVEQPGSAFWKLMMLRMMPAMTKYNCYVKNI